MRIVVFSLGVVFPNVVQGGSQRVLIDVCLGLTQRGHKITILCPKRNDNCTVFLVGSNIVVKPVLPLRGAFPAPYAVSPLALTQTCQIVLDELNGADLLYCHDGGLNIDFLKSRIPTVISLRDFCYPETLLGALNFHEEAVVVNSMHTYGCLQDSFVRVNPMLKDRVHVIFNGYDAHAFQRTKITASFCKSYNIPMRSDEKVIGFPHRPELSKGFPNALRVLKQLSDVWGSQIKLLVPLYMDQGLSTRTDDTYHQIQSMVNSFHLQDNIIYHPWVSHEEMPQYYSYCDVILCIGNFVEAFSNVSVESLLCGTPVVAANTSTYRTMPVRQFLQIVPYGAIEETTLAVNDILNGKLCCDTEEARGFISQELTMEKMIDAYEQVFRQAKQSFLSSHTVQNYEDILSKTDGVYYKLASWCDICGGYIYDDYRGEYFADPFCGAFTNPETRCSKGQLLLNGVTEATIEQAVEKGFLIVCR